MRRLFVAHYAAIWRLLRRLGVPSAQLDDAAQEVFWVAARKFADIREGSEHSFLYGVAIRVASQEHRRRRHAPQTTTVDALAVHCDLAPSPEAHLELRPAGARVARRRSGADADRPPHRLRSLRAGRARGAGGCVDRGHSDRHGELSTASSARGILCDHEACSSELCPAKEFAMVTPDRGDDEFERALLRSASRDAPDAEETQRAWSRFAGAMASLAPPATGPRAGHVPPVTGSVGRWSRVANATTWLAIGAIGGCAVTFALVGRRGEAPTVSAPARSSAAPATASPPRIATCPLPQAAPPGSALPAPQPSARVGSSSSTSRSGDHRLAQGPGGAGRAAHSPASR